MTGNLLIYSANARIFWLVVLFIGNYSQSLYSQQITIFPENIRIVLDHSSGRNRDALDQKKIEQKWQSTCKEMGKSLLIGQGPYGFGVFTSYSCYFNDKRVYGKDMESQWELVVVDGPKEVEIKLLNIKEKPKPVDHKKETKSKINEKRKSKKGKLPQETEDGNLETEDHLKDLDAPKDEIEPVLRVTFPGSQATLDYLGHQDFLDIISLMILDSMPMLAVVSPKAIKDNRIILKGEKYRTRRWPLPMPPKTLSAFLLKYDVAHELWISTLVTTLRSDYGEDRADFFDQAKKVVERKRLEEKNKKSKKDQKQDDQIKPKPVKPLHWQSEELDRKIQGVPIWLHSSSGRGSMYFELNELLKTAYKEISKESAGDLLVNAVAATIGAGLVGVRYGFGLFKSADSYLVDKFKSFALIVEVRGGPLEGLRFYYDLSPEVKDTYNDLALKYRSSRFVLGWSFGLDLTDFFLIDRIDIVPKIGQWTFDAALPKKEQRRNATTGESTEEFVIFEFKLDTAISTGYEIGVEKLIMFTLVRGWLAQDRAFAFLSTATNAAQSGGTVTSLRLGIDSYWDGPKITEIFDWTFLLFYFFESITVDKDDNITPPFSYSQAYVGAGVSLAW